MLHKETKQIDEIIGDTTLLVETISSEIIQATTKIYACYLPGEINSLLFIWKDEHFLSSFIQHFSDLKKAIEDNLANLPYDKTDEILIVANLLTEIREYDLAVEIYQNLLKSKPENYFIWANLMTIYFHQGDHIKSMECYVHLPPEFLEQSSKEKLHPESDAYRVLNISSAYPLHSSLRSLSNRIQESTEMQQQYEQELRELYSIREFVDGQEALSNGNPNEALILLSSATTSYPESHILHYFTGKAAFEGKHYIIAEENFKKAIQLKNNIPEYWNGLAECSFAQHKNDQAIKALKSSLTLDHEYSAGWKLAGRMISTIESHGDYDYFIEQLQLMPSAESIVKFVEGVIERKRFETAFEILQTGVQKFPDNTRLLENLGLVYERMGMVDDAISTYEELLLSGKSVQKYLKKITSILSVLHDDKRLVRVLKLVSSSLPWDESTLWNKIGDLLMKAKDYLGASEAFRKVISVTDDDPKILFNLALAYQELRLYKKAEEIYQRVLNLNSNDHATLNNLGNVLKEQKRYDEAIECYQKATDIEPRKAISWANLGILYEELRLKKEASECYNKAKEIAIQNKDYKSAAKFDEWENSV